MVLFDSFSSLRRNYMKITFVQIYSHVIHSHVILVLLLQLIDFISKHISNRKIFYYSIQQGFSNSGSRPKSW